MTGLLKAEKLKPKDLPVIDPWAFLWGAAYPLPLTCLTINFLYPKLGTFVKKKVVVVTLRPQIQEERR